MQHFVESTGMLWSWNWRPLFANPVTNDNSNVTSTNRFTVYTNGLAIATFDKFSYRTYTTQGFFPKIIHLYTLQII